MTGNSLSVFLAEIKLNQLENEFIKNIPSIIFYNRYIDYCCMVVKRSDLHKIRQQLSSQEFKFNIEFETFDAQYSEFGCPYLDKFIDVKIIISNCAGTRKIIYLQIF